MSSVEFHEDEWGRHWSYAPALHGTQVRLNYPLVASLLEGVASLAEAVAARWALPTGQDRAAFESAARLRDVHGEDYVPPIRHARYEGVRDEFGRLFL